MKFPFSSALSLFLCLNLGGALTSCHRNASSEGLSQVRTADAIRHAAEQGEAQAQYELGLMYYNGDGVQADLVKGFEWMRKAAEQGHAVAQFNLFLSYENGMGGEQDHEQAVLWLKKAEGGLRKAADQGDAKAAYCLWRMYDNGWLVDRDPVKSAEWLQKAAERGHAESQYQLGVTHARNRHYAQAAEWFEKAEKQGHGKARPAFGEICYELGEMYAKGREVAQDPVQAAQWYLKGAERENADAQSRLGMMYARGNGVAQDLPKAAKWLCKAAEHGSNSASVVLMDLCSRKEGGCQGEKLGCEAGVAKTLEELRETGDIPKADR